MLKYVDTQVTFAEVPNEIALCINISNCPCNCEGCHSHHLALDTGNPLDWGSLNALIHINHGITCVAFMGGDADPAAVSKLAEKVKRLDLKTCWYSGRPTISEAINIDNFDFIKVGPYMTSKGPLTSRTTNQRFYAVVHEDETKLKDITPFFWKEQFK